MDFFAEKDKYKSRSRIFLIAFIPAVILAVSVLYLALNGCVLLISWGTWSGTIWSGGGFLQRESGYTSYDKTVSY